MKPDPPYEELAEIIARHLREERLMAEQIEDGTMVTYIDHGFSSAYQIAAGVLQRLNLLSPPDSDGPYLYFTCAPDEFAAVAARNKDNGCSYDTLMLALVCLAQQEEPNVLYVPREDWPTELRNYCIEIGLCEPVEPPTIKLTAKGERVDALYNDWPRLLEE